MTRSPGRIMSKSAIAAPTRRRRRFASLFVSYLSFCVPMLNSQMNAASAVYRDDLPGDIGRVVDQEAHCAGDVFRFPHALEQRTVNDPLACEIIGPAFVFGPQDRPRGDPVYPYFRPELRGERAGQREQPALRHTVDCVVAHGALGMD